MRSAREKPRSYQEQLQQQHQQKQQALAPRPPAPGGPGVEPAVSGAAGICRVRISGRSDPMGCNSASERGAGYHHTQERLLSGWLRKRKGPLSRPFLRILATCGAQSPLLEATVRVWHLPSSVDRMTACPCPRALRGQESNQMLPSPTEDIWSSTEDPGPFLSPGFPLGARGAAAGGG